MKRGVTAEEGKRERRRAGSQRERGGEVETGETLYTYSI